MICTCMQYAPPEILMMWRRRVKPIIRRLITHGHGVSTREMAETIRLVLLLERGGPEVTSEKNWNRSHHLRSCPFNPHITPFNKIPIDTVSTEER